MAGPLPPDAPLSDALLAGPLGDEADAADEADEADDELELDEHALMTTRAIRAAMREKVFRFRRIRLPPVLIPRDVATAGTLGANQSGWRLRE
jgi:hypothetical protein